LIIYFQMKISVIDILIIYFLTQINMAMLQVNDNLQFNAMKKFVTILVGVEGGSQELDGESMTLLVCPLNVYYPLNIVSLQIDSTRLDSPPIVVVERQVDVPDTDVPSALSM